VASFFQIPQTPLGQATFGFVFSIRPKSPTRRESWVRFSKPYLAICQPLKFAIPLLPLRKNGFEAHFLHATPNCSSFFQKCRASNRSPKFGFVFSKPHIRRSRPRQIRPFFASASQNWLRSVYPPQNWVRFFKSPPAVDSAPNRRKDP
jgi:hypothetical protein